MKRIIYFYQDETGTGYDELTTDDPKTIERFESYWDGSGKGCIYIKTQSITEV